MEERLRKAIVTDIEELKAAIRRADGQTMVSISLDVDEREVPGNAKGGKIPAQAGRGKA